MAWGGMWALANQDVAGPSLETAEGVEAVDLLHVKALRGSV